ncbi:MAG: sel1 repeat family protein [Acholeplasmataceae bacterium]|nr:MAG: sel1 repeat family protein [Acholeplasmataceae bacterium]
MNANTHYQAGLSNYILNTKQKNIMAALEHFNQAAASGHADAYFFLGRFHGLGDNVSVDFGKALDLYRKGAALGSYKCHYAMALMYHHGYGVDKDETTALRLFRDSFQSLRQEAEEGDPVSIHLLGTFFYYGFAVQRYLFSAIEWFMKAADMGYADSQYMLGMIYETISSDEVESQQEKAKIYYEKAAEQDHPYALYALGVIYLEEKIWPKAIVYLEKAARQQYPLAMYTLGMYHHERNSQNPLKAYEWFLAAAKHQHVRAEYHVGLYHQHGKGVPQSIEKAVYWYERAAAQKDRDALYHLAMILMQEEEKDYSIVFGLLQEAAHLDHPNAQYNLAVMYQKGDGVAINGEQAFYWYEKAAKAGLAIAQYNLGMLHFEGVVVEKDEEQARFWWQKAADQGLEVAVKLMQSIGNYAKLQKSPWSS